MRYLKPHFYDKFVCTAGACPDTCCAGWEIEVDETTAEGDLAEKGAFGDRLRREIGSEPGEYFFKLKNNRCPFLNKENLCDIFINLGEDRLCDICREHPRFYNWFGDYTEVSIGPCPPQARRPAGLPPPAGGGSTGPSGPLRRLRRRPCGAPTWPHPFLHSTPFTPPPAHPLGKPSGR